MPSWIGQAAHRGILTSRYPRAPATEAEVPMTARAPGPPAAGPLPAAAISVCPVGAIGERAVDQGRCIRCARCLAHGLQPVGPVELTVARAEALVAPPGARDPPAPAPPLASLGRSIHVFLVDVGSCNACNLEVLGIANPLYDAARLGIFFTNSPRHADVLLVVGVPTEEMVEPLRRAYEAMPAPKSVIAIGACPISGGAFRGNPGLRPSLDGLVPVDRFVPGCPPAPIQILDALLTVSGRNRREG